MLLIKSFKKKKIVSKSTPLIGEFFFCFHKSFKEKNFTNFLNSIRGLKYFINGYKNYQSELIKFIDKCKKVENKDGLIEENLCNIYLNRTYKFISGPFKDSIFKIIDFKKNNLNILLGNTKVALNKNNYLFNPA